MKPPAAVVKKALAKKIKARRSPGAGQQEPVPKRLRIREPQPPVRKEPPTPPEVDLTADTPPERTEVPGATGEGLTTGEPTAEEAPALHDSLPAEADRGWGEGPSGAVSPPPEGPASGPPLAEPERAGETGEGVQPVPRGFSLMNDGHRAERLIAEFLQPDFMDELRNLGVNRFFREAYSSIIRMTHSLALTREAIGESETRNSHLLAEVADARARADAAEENLARARADCADEIRRAEENLARARTDCADEVRRAEERVEAADRRQHAALDRMADAESAVEARNFRIADLEASLRAAEDRARRAEGEAQRAKEAEESIAIILAEKEARVIEVEAAAEVKASSAVEEYKASESFIEEVAEANADYFLQGFEKAKEKIARVLEVPRALEIEPDPEPEDASDSDPAADA